MLGQFKVSNKEHLSHLFLSLKQTCQWLGKGSKKNRQIIHILAEVYNIYTKEFFIHIRGPPPSPLSTFIKIYEIFSSSFI